MLCTNGVWIFEIFGHGIQFFLVLMCSLMETVLWIPLSEGEDSSDSINFVDFDRSRPLLLLFSFDSDQEESESTRLFFFLVALVRGLLLFASSYFFFSVFIGRATVSSTTNLLFWFLFALALGNCFVLRLVLLIILIDNKIKNVE